MQKEKIPPRSPQENLKEQMKPILTDILKYSPSKLVGFLGNLAVVPIYTNLLSPEQYGLYGMAVAALSFLCIIFSDWIGISGLRFFRAHQIKDDIPKYLTTLLLLLALNLSFLFIIAFIFKSYFCASFKIPLKIFIATLVLIIPVAIRALLFQLLRAQIKPGAYTFSTILNQFLTIALAIFIIKNSNLGGASILLAMGISITMIDILLLFQSNILSYFRFEKIQFNILSSLFKYGFPIALASISVWSITQSNKFILQHFRGLSEVGLVSAAYNLTFPLLMTIFAIIPIAAFPRIINIYEAKEDVRPIISKLTEYFMIIALPVIVIGSLFSKEIVMFFANSRFHDAYVLLPYLGFSAFFLGLSEYTTMQYHLINKTHIDTGIKVTSGIIGIALNIALIPSMGLLGVGIATLCANILYFVLSVIIIIPNLEWQVPYKSIIILFLSFIPMSFCYAFFKKISPDFNAAFEISFLLIIYYAAFFALKRIKKEAF